MRMYPRVFASLESSFVVCRTCWSMGGWRWGAGAYSRPDRGGPCDL